VNAQLADLQEAHLLEDGLEVAGLRDWRKDSVREAQHFDEHHGIGRRLRPIP
jgi:hypothetical protein